MENYMNLRKNRIKHKVSNGEIAFMYQQNRVNEINENNEINEIK